jgi:hypothetical protein
VPVVDLAVANPIGLSLSTLSRRRVGRLAIHHGRAVLTDSDGTTLVDLPAGRLFDESAVRATRGLAGAELLIDDGDDVRSPAPRPGDRAHATAQRIAEFAATGLGLSASTWPDEVAAHLDPAVRALLLRPLPASTDTVAHDSGEAHPAGAIRSDDPWADRLRWQAHSARQRREVLRRHGAPFALGESSGRNPLPEVSVLLVTNRPAMVAAAIGALARQTYPRLEVIVGLHGPSAGELPDDARSALASLGHPSTVLPIDADRPLGEALTLCTRAAAGTLVVKMDDDDHYGPEHVWDLVLAQIFSGADLVGKAPEVTELQSSTQLVLRSFAQEETWGAYVIGATMLVARGPLLDVGGWRPTPWAVDKALLDRFGQRGRNIYRTQNLGWAYVRRGSGHTWEQDDAYFRGQAKQVWSGAAMDDLLNLVVEQA